MLVWTERKYLEHGVAGDPVCSVDRALDSMNLFKLEGKNAMRKVNFYFISSVLSKLTHNTSFGKNG